MTSVSLALGQIEVALESIPQVEKAAYTEALKKAPQLVKAESNPIKFIQTCRYDVWDAARRLVNYWEERKRLFGERAFLPMTQTGDGALSPDDLLLLHAGYPALIPGNETNGPVLFFDRRRNLSSSSTESRMRCSFYLLTVASEDVRTRTQGLGIFILFITPRVSDFDRAGARHFIGYILNQVAPCRATIHRLECMPKGQSKRTLLEELLRIGVEICASFNGNTLVHRESKPGQILNELRENKYTADSIPVSVGGNWNFEEFTNQWCKDRAALERRQMGKQEIPSASIEELLVAEAVPSAGTDVDARSRRRMINVVHSRRKRERRKQEQSSLMDEKNALLEERRSLEKEEALLKVALAQAQTLVQALKASGKRANAMESSAVLRAKSRSPQAQGVVQFPRNYTYQCASPSGETGTIVYPEVVLPSGGASISQEVDATKTSSQSTADTRTPPIEAGMPKPPMAAMLDPITFSLRAGESFALDQNSFRDMSARAAAQAPVPSCDLSTTLDLNHPSNIPEQNQLMQAALACRERHPIATLAAQQHQMSQQQIVYSSFPFFQQQQQQPSLPSQNNNQCENAFLTPQRVGSTHQQFFGLENIMFLQLLPQQSDLSNTSTGNAPFSPTQNTGPISSSGPTYGHLPHNRTFNGSLGHVRSMQDDMEFSEVLGLLAQSESKNG